MAYGMTQPKSTDKRDVKALSGLALDVTSQCYCSGCYHGYWLIAECKYQRALQESFIVERKEMHAQI